MELTLQNRKILIASILELQETIDMAFLHSMNREFDFFVELQKERVNRLEHFDTGYRERGTATDNPGE